MHDFFANTAAWASVICYAAAALGCVYALAAAWAARGFVRSATAAGRDCPAVTILKPLHGLEPDLYANLAGFCAQLTQAPCKSCLAWMIPPIRPSASSASSSPIFPLAISRLVINSRRHGENRKVSNLINMARQARHEVVVVSDSDIVVAPDYLKSIAAALESPGVGPCDVPLPRRRGDAASGRGSRRRRSTITSCPTCLSGSSSALPRPASARRSRCASKTLADDRRIRSHRRSAGRRLCAWRAGASRRTDRRDPQLHRRPCLRGAIRGRSVPS